MEDLTERPAQSADYPLKKPARISRAGFFL
jgi:hypothetical protein